MHVRDLATRATAVCLATVVATLSASTSADAALLELQGDCGTRASPSVFVASDDGGLDAGTSTGVQGLVSELGRAQGAESVLNAMIKINEAVDSDQEGLSEDPFAREASV